MQNQMKAFSILMESPEKPLVEGTIIRIPLRTQAQAEVSEISDQPTTVSDIQQVLECFATEFRDGLLFMRNLEKLKIEFDNKSIGVQVVDRQSTRQ